MARPSWTYPSDYVYEISGLDIAEEIIAYKLLQQTEM